MPSFRAFSLFAASSVRSTMTGSWVECPRVFGLVSLRCWVYQAVALRIPEVYIRFLEIQRDIIHITSVVTIVRRFIVSSTNSSFSGMNIRARKEPDALKSRDAGDRHSRIELIIECPYSLLINLCQGFQTVVERQRTVSNFFYHSLQ